MNNAIVTQADRDNDARIDAWKARQIEASRRVTLSQRLARAFAEFAAELAEVERTGSHA